MLCAIIDDEEEVLNIDPERDLDFVLTFECDGVRYQRKVSDCDGEHIQARLDAEKAHFEAENARLKAEVAYFKAACAHLEAVREDLETRLRPTHH